MVNIIEASRFWPEEERLLYIVPETMYGASVSEYGKRLRELREKNKLPRQKLADEVKCTQQNIERIETGKAKTINKEYVPIFAKMLGCSCSYLLGFSKHQTGLWSKPDTDSEGQYMPIFPYRPDEIIAIRALAGVYNRDIELFNLCMKMLREDNPKRRSTYKNGVRELLRTKEN